VKPFYRLIYPLLTLNNTGIFTIVNNHRLYPNTISTNIHSLNMNSFLGKYCVCLEITPSEKMTKVSQYSVCYDCIRQMFQRALDYGGDYLPKWGKHT
jgi:hypothetical protein